MSQSQISAEIDLFSFLGFFEFAPFSVLCKDYVKLNIKLPEIALVSEN